MLLADEFEENETLIINIYYVDLLPYQAAELLSKSSNYGLLKCFNPLTEF
jgi:hypothetical protein